MLKRLILRWQHRRTPHHDLAEQHEMFIRFARRCAYDFAHAVDFLPRDHWICTDLRMHERPQYWLTLFKAGNPSKDYRLKIHGEIDKLNAHVAALEKFCDEKGLMNERPHLNDMPF